ncbi:MAG: taurine dioxygenase [Deltaproteobacteria bacterium]|nr:taurine dioxygenase [Deltaproteobacteria bacterium]
MSAAIESHRPLHYGPRRHIAAIRERLDALNFDRFEVVPQAPCLGGEVRGVDLSKPMDAALAADIERALVEYKVLFFRDQKISQADHAAFAAQFGELEVHPFLPEGASPEVIRFAKDEEVVGVENNWHSDVSWRQVPSLGSVLRAHEVPGVGGDTLWTDMEAVYDGLSDEIKKEIDGRVAIHDFVHTFGLAMSEEDRAEKRKEFPPAHHPLVRTHPVSGRKCLYVNTIFTSHIDGLPDDESRDLLARLYQEVEIPEYQVRFRWEKDSVAFWDNRSTQHYASSDYWPRERVMERITIIGDTPR